jgi:thiosulfate dehydrogenase (quinone) large subunit
MSKFFGPSPLSDAPFFKGLFSDTRWSWLWLIARVYVGYQWINGALHKLTDPAWMKTGEAIQGYWMHAVSIPEAPARPPIYFDWYRGLIQGLIDSNASVVFGKLVSVGELLIGIALIAGVFVGTAAFFGGLLNMSFLLAGSLSAGPAMLAIEILLMVAWKIAGHLGGNFFIHKYFGTFWQPGPLLKRKV